MKFLQNTFLLIIVLFFTACSSKNEVKVTEQINSFSLDKNIYIAGTPQTVKSPISINLGLGGYVTKHVGIHTSTSVRPDISNDDGVNLEKGVSKYSISLADLIRSEFKKQMSRDSFYKNKYVPFGADYRVKLSVLKYELDDSFFSSKAHIKIYMQMDVLDKNYKLVYSDKQVNSIESSQVQFTQAQILRDRAILVKTLNESISNTLAKLIIEMKKN